MRLRHLVAATVAATLVAPAFAGGVPSQVMNNTITISFATSGMDKSPGGKSHGFSVAVYHTIYVSSAGRLFRCYRATTGRYSTGGDFAPGAAGGSFSFQRNRLVGIIPWATGARQIIVTFDSSFSSCPASTIEGRLAGVIRRQGIDRKVYEVSEVTSSKPICSIQSGNAFVS